MDSGQTIANEAQRWMGTPYHHCADVLHFGVDCAMLLVRVVVDPGLAEPFDPRPYPPDWYLHRDEERFRAIVEQYADKIPDGESPRIGDIPLFKFGRCLAHGGVVVAIEPEPIMIHADKDAGRVVRCEVRRWEDRLAGYWRLRA